MTEPIDSTGTKKAKKKKAKKKDSPGVPETPPTTFAENSAPSPKGRKSPQKRKASTSKSPKRDKNGKAPREKSPKKTTDKQGINVAKLPENVPLSNGVVVVETVDEDNSSQEDELPEMANGNKTREMVNPQVVEKRRKMEVHTGNGVDATRSGNQPSPTSKKIENEAPPLTEEERKQVLRDAREYLNADIRLISACKDGEQTSDCSNVLERFGLRQSQRGSLAVGYDGGACTSVLLKLLYEHHNDPTKANGTAPKWIDLLHRAREELKEKGYKQVPAFTSSRPVSMKHEFNIIPKNYNGGNKRALIIGIRYKGQPWELPGCHNDCHNMVTYLKRMHDFKDEDITILMDDGTHMNPTRENILKAFHRFAFSVKAGDAAFFHFSGHGSSKLDESGDEESGFDQTLMPVDVMTKGDIVDDEIFRILLVPLPRGLELTAVVDCCHSGTVFDLPFEFIGDAKYESGNEMDFRKVSFPHMKMVRAERRRIQALKEVVKVGDLNESFVEREIIVSAPVRPKANKLSFAMASISEGGGKKKKKKKLKAAVPIDDDHPTPAEMHRPPNERTTDQPSLIALGCCLLCLNPCKFFK